MMRLGLLNDCNVSLHQRPSQVVRFGVGITFQRFPTLRCPISYVMSKRGKVETWRVRSTDMLSGTSPLFWEFPTALRFIALSWRYPFSFRQPKWVANYGKSIITRGSIFDQLSDLFRVYHTPCTSLSLFPFRNISRGGLFPNTHSFIGEWVG